MTELFTDYEPWLGAAAIMTGITMLVAVVVAHRRSKQRWSHVRPSAPALNARDAVLARSRTERFIAPAIDAVSSTTTRLMKPSLVAEADLLLERTGPRRWLTGSRLVALKVLLVPISAIGAFVLLGGHEPNLRLLGTVLAALIAWRFPRMYIDRLIAQRSAEVTRELPDVLDQITVSVGAGLGLEAALTRVAERSSGVLAQELGRTMQDIRLGVDRIVAYQRLAQRGSSEDLSSVVGSIVQSLETGASLVPSLKARALELRRKRRSRAEERAQKLSVKLALPTALCILPSLMMVVLGPTIVRVLEGGLTG